MLFLSTLGLTVVLGLLYFLAAAALGIAEAGWVRARFGVTNDR